MNEVAFIMINAAIYVYHIVKGSFEQFLNSQHKYEMSVLYIYK